MIPHPTYLCELSGRDNRLIHRDDLLERSDYGSEERSDDDAGSVGRSRFPLRGRRGWVRLGFADEPQQITRSFLLQSEEVKVWTNV